MRKLMLLSLVLLTTSTGYGNISKTSSFFSTINNMEMVENSNKIDLSGTMTSTGVRSLSIPVSAFKYPDYIEVTLSRFLGEIVIKIYDDTNTIVYEEIINTSAQSNLLISTGFLEIGVYTIEFTNSQGQYMCGDFVVQE